MGQAFWGILELWIEQMRYLWKAWNTNFFLFNFELIKMASVQGVTIVRTCPLIYVLMFYFRNFGHILYNFLVHDLLKQKLVTQTFQWSWWAILMLFYQRWLKFNQTFQHSKQNQFASCEIICIFVIWNKYV